MKSRRAFIGSVALSAAWLGVRRAFAAETPLAVDGVALPDWAVRTIREGAARFAAWRGEDDVIAFPLITDIHSRPVPKGRPMWQETRLHVLFQRAIAEATGSDFLANLGDLDLDVNVPAEAQEGFAKVYRSEPRPVLFAMGNHDHGKGLCSSRQFGDAFCRGLNAGKAYRFGFGPDGTWGCLDLPGKKFRAIWLNTSDEGYLGFSVGQLQHLADRLADAPEGWHVAILQHATVPHFISKWRRCGDSNGNLAREDLEQAIVEDYANRRGGLVSGFGKNTKYGELGGVKWDFSGVKSHLVGIFQGHLHAESYLKYARVNYVIRPGYGTIPADCACGEWREPKRESNFNCASDMMMDLVCVRMRTHEVKIFRFGCGGEKSELAFRY